MFRLMLYKIIFYYFVVGASLITELSTQPTELAKQVLIIKYTNQYK